MKIFIRKFRSLILLAIFLVSVSTSFAAKQYHGRVADPSTGASAANAKVYVLFAGTDDMAAVFSDEDCQVSADNPVIADSNGRYSFYAPTGKYRLYIDSSSDVLLYDHDDITIYDPRDPREVWAEPGKIALTLSTPPRSGDINLPMMIERLDGFGDLLGARWRYQTHNTEVGFATMYNMRRRGGVPNAHDLFNIDSATEGNLSPGSNDADDGIMTWPGIRIDAGGAWLGEAHLTSIPLMMANPVRDPGDDPYAPGGILIYMNAPDGLETGDVVVLDDSQRITVKTTNELADKVPFVVGKVDDTGTFVVVRGLAWVKVIGDVAPNDILVSSPVPGYAKEMNVNESPTTSLGVAVGSSANGMVLAKIMRVSPLYSRPENPSPADGATDVGVNPVFQWTPAPKVDSQVMYFGTSPDNLTEVAVLSADQSEVMAIEAGAPFLTYTTYYWRVDGIFDSVVFPGEVYSFTTGDVSDPTTEMMDVSSVHNELIANYVFDGVTGQNAPDTLKHSRWSSAESRLAPCWIADPGNNEWIWINLGEEQRIETVSIDFDECAAVDYTIRVMDSETASRYALEKNGTATGSVDNWSTIATATGLPAGNLSERGVAGVSDAWDFTTSTVTIPGNISGDAVFEDAAPIGQFVLIDTTKASNFWGNVSMWEIVINGISYSAADFNKDWDIDLQDLMILAEVWLNTGVGMPQDLHPDEKIDFKDFSVFTQEWSAD